jgi:hypothetical protein
MNLWLENVGNSQVRGEDPSLAGSGNQPSTATNPNQARDELLRQMLGILPESYGGPGGQIVLAPGTTTTKSWSYGTGQAADGERSFSGGLNAAWRVIQGSLGGGFSSTKEIDNTITPLTQLTIKAGPGTVLIEKDGMTYAWPNNGDQAGYLSVQLLIAPGAEVSSQGSETAGINWNVGVGVKGGDRNGVGFDGSYTENNQKGKSFSTGNSAEIPNWLYDAMKRAGLFPPAQVLVSPRQQVFGLGDRENYLNQQLANSPLTLQEYLQRQNEVYIRYAKAIGEQRSRTSNQQLRDFLDPSKKKDNADYQRILELLAQELNLPASQQPRSSKDIQNLEHAKNITSAWWETKSN